MAHGHRSHSMSLSPNARHEQGRTQPIVMPFAPLQLMRNSGLPCPPPSKGTKRRTPRPRQQTPKLRRQTAPTAGCDWHDVKRLRLQQPGTPPTPGKQHQAIQAAVHGSDPPTIEEASPVRHAAGSAAAQAPVVAHQQNIFTQGTPQPSTASLLLLVEQVKQLVQERAKDRERTAEAAAAEGRAQADLQVPSISLQMMRCPARAPSACTAALVHACIAALAHQHAGFVSLFLLYACSVT